MIKIECKKELELTIKGFKAKRVCLNWSTEGSRTFRCYS